MNKFTIVTLILSITVTTVMTQLVLREYFDSGEGQSSVLAPVTVEPVSPVLEPEPDQSEEEASFVDVSPAEEFIPAEEPAELNEANLPGFLTRELIAESGFGDDVSEDIFDRKVFHLLDIARTPSQGEASFLAKDNGIPIASFTEILLAGEIPAQNLYVLLQNKSKTYLDLTLNETNQLGDQSFYINHSRKPEEAFLVVKIKNVVYAFSYVKAFHEQVKTLVSKLSDIIAQQYGS